MVELAGTNGCIAGRPEASGELDDEFWAILPRILARPPRDSRIRVVTKTTAFVATLAGLLAATATWGQPAFRHATTVEALTRYPLFFHGKQVIVRGAVAAPAHGVLALRSADESVRPVFLVLRSGGLEEGPVEVRGEFWDLGRLSPDDPRIAGIDLQRLLDQVTQGRWPAQGQTPVMVVQTTTAPEPLPPGVRAIALEPDRFEGQHVRVIGGFRGANLHGDLPQSPGRSRWDFVLRSADAAVWVLGERPRGKGFNLDPSRRLDTGRALEVTGTVRTDRGLVWIDADSVTLTTEAVPAGVVEAPLPPVQGAPPQVAFSIPIDGDIDVQPDATIRIQFTRDMAPESFRERVRISYADAGHTPLPEPKTVYRGDNRVLEVRPAAPLERFGTVKVELLEGIEATDGAPLAPWVMTFTVAGT
jgi:hypothetical protein